MWLATYESRNFSWAGAGTWKWQAYDALVACWNEYAKEPWGEGKDGQYGFGDPNDEVSFVNLKPGTGYRDWSYEVTLGKEGRMAKRMTDEEREREEVQHGRRNYLGIGKSPRARRSVAEAAGWECHDCGKLISGESIYYHGEGSPENPRPESRREYCPYCGSEDVSPVGLTENEQRFEDGGDVNQQWRKTMSLEGAIEAGVRAALRDVLGESDDDEG